MVPSIQAAGRRPLPRLIASDPRIDAAILDLNLNGEPAYPIADALLERGVRIIFTTGYDESAIPERDLHILRCGKPVTRHMLRTALAETGECAAPIENGRGRAR